MSGIACAVCCGCVAVQFALIGAGSAALAAAGRDEVQPALIATVVGLQLLPFAWAFSEPMFYVLGGAVAVLGATGIVLGGLVMLVISTLYARGRFARALVEHRRPGSASA